MTQIAQYNIVNVLSSRTHCIHPSNESLFEVIVSTSCDISLYDTKYRTSNRNVNKIHRLQFFD